MSYVSLAPLICYDVYRGGGRSRIQHFPNLLDHETFSFLILSRPEFKPQYCPPKIVFETSSCQAPVLGGGEKNQAVHLKYVQSDLGYTCLVCNKTLGSIPSTLPKNPHTLFSQ
jgi:hypothetical protein